MNKCPRCDKSDETVLLDNDGLPYLCDECWNNDEPNNKREKLMNDNLKCDKGECETCYPIYYYDEATDTVLVRREN